MVCGGGAGKPIEGALSGALIAGIRIEAAIPEPALAQFVTTGAEGLTGEFLPPCGVTTQTSTTLPNWNPMGIAALMAKVCTSGRIAQDVSKTCSPLGSKF
jgi:hypothetical protein